MFKVAGRSRDSLCFVRMFVDYVIPDNLFDMPVVLLENQTMSLVVPILFDECNDWNDDDDDNGDDDDVAVSALFSPSNPFPLHILLILFYCVQGSNKNRNRRSPSEGENGS